MRVQVVMSSQLHLIADLHRVDLETIRHRANRLGSSLVLDACCRILPGPADWLDNSSKYHRKGNKPSKGAEISLSFFSSFTLSFR